jgi:adenine-specific DNA methylase
MLLSRYLGNKAVLLDQILSVTATRCQPGDRVLDAFSGSLAVSMAYKRAGYRVSANDINPLSAAFGRAYLENCVVPSCPLDDLVSKRRARVLRAESDARVHALEGTEGFDFLADDASRMLYRDLFAGLLHLQLVDEEMLPAGQARTDFFDAYCPEGRFSAFRSSRGREGRRRFLTAENARRLDLVMSQLRSWRHQRALPESTHWLFVAVACHALEKVANTQGTYHDFPRDVWDSRAFKPLTLAPPPLDGVLIGPGGHLIGQEDSVTFAAKAGSHRLAYVDPPYNFRQYTAYYFLPNLVASYPDLDAPDDYFAALTYVRGQNPLDDFTSDFCSATKFLAAMRNLLAASNAGSVLVSYFTGKNHWSDFDSDRSNAGLDLLSGLLREDPFEPGSLTIVEVPRTNYASYGGYRARKVHELLLLADKARDPASRRAVSATGGA